MNRKALALLLSGALCLTLAAGCSSDGGGSAAKDSTPPGTAAQQTPSAAPSPSGDPAPVETPDAAPGDTLESSGTLGDYGVEIKDFALAKDYTGASAIVITYTFTNNSEEAAAAMVALSDTAYQNGLQLDIAVIADSSVCDPQSAMLEVKTGGSIDVQKAYVLVSETAPVSIEIGELFSFSGDKLGKTFEISEGGVTELATIDVPADAVTGSVGDYEVSIISCTAVKDYQGADAVVITYGFTNHSDKTTNFMTAVRDIAYQDSVQLTSAVIGDTDVHDSTDVMRNVQPGASVIVTSAYTTTSTSPIEVEVGALFGGTSITRTFTLE